MPVVFPVFHLCTLDCPSYSNVECVILWMVGASHKSAHSWAMSLSWLVLLKFGSIQFFRKICEPWTWPKFSSAFKPEPQIEPMLTCSGGSVHIQNGFKPFKIIFCRLSHIPTEWHTHFFTVSNTSWAWCSWRLNLARSKMIWLHHPTEQPF